MRLYPLFWGAAALLRTPARKSRATEHIFREFADLAQVLLLGARRKPAQGIFLLLALVFIAFKIRSPLSPQQQAACLNPA